MTTRMLSNMNVHKNTVGKYKIVKTLGSGLLKVKLVYDPISTKYYAAKVCKDKLKAPALEREANILRELNNVNVPNIIKCVEFIDSIDMSPKNTYQLDFNSIVVTPQENKYKGALILELASNGTMFDIIYYNQKLEEKLARTYFKKVVETVSALHAQGYVHRDLKCENILLDDQFQLKLADFGFAKDISQLNGSLMKTRLGTESYMAPEMFTAKKYSGEKIDAFACGVLLFLFIFGRPPFFKASVRDPYYKNFDQDRPEKFWKIYEDKLNNGKEFDINLKGLISDLLKCDPDDRLDVKDIYDYSWMKDEVYSDKELMEVMKPLKDIVKKGAKLN